MLSFAFFAISGAECVEQLNDDSSSGMPRVDLEKSTFGVRYGGLVLTVYTSHRLLQTCT